ncbi:hypothetical protein [Blautia marasmi]|uniref:hypothetical protein n=1 Tax=Blautia marasmi TaxID=1917868 RepID=UPI001D063876|nr:hypothetical protein [Blautia marasmi]MCB6191492.1 hypothetical protein [Blautia marasmi]
MKDIRYILTSGRLLVELPSKMKFDFEFLHAMNEFLEIASVRSIKRVCVTCDADAEYDNMTKAYTYIALKYLLHIKETLWHKKLASIILPSIHAMHGNQFAAVTDLSEIIQNPNLNYYMFTRDSEVSKPVEEMTNLLVEKNITINQKELKEFLSTTIGEIFSNSINHSNQEAFFFMYDIMYENEDFYLCINIIDYGKTIIDNVQAFHQNPQMSGSQCIEWAIQSGNTTRKGSGGYGLPTLIHYIKEVDGELYIFSGDAFYCFDGQKEKITDARGYLSGTSVTFRVKLFNTEKAITYSGDRLGSIRLDNI